MTLGERFIKDILDKDNESNHYLNELLKIEELNEKQENDLFRFADLLSVMEHKEANIIAKNAIDKIKNIDKNAIHAKLNMFLKSDFKIEMDKLPFDRQFEYQTYLDCL